MNESFRLGRIAGIPVGANWSVAVIFLLTALGVAGGRLPAEHPGAGGGAYAAAGLVAAVLFFASLLAHEVAHAVVARRNGLPVDGITLWLFGGVSRLRGEPRTPGADFRIAAVGPAVSLALALAFALLAAGAVAAGIDGLAVGVARYLAFINLMLGLFNLVPAAPLDGGRVLRAALWRWRGDKTRAAVGAARAGRLFGFVLVGLGFVQVLSGAGVGGFWLALIGFFIVSAASAEAQQAVVSDALAGVRVRDVMTPEPLSAPVDLPVSRFLDEYVLTHRYSSYPLTTSDGRPAGLVTLSCLRTVAPEKRAWTTVGEVAVPPAEVPTAAPDELLVELLGRTEGRTDGRALVVEGGRVVGIVSPRDVARLLEVRELERRPLVTPYPGEVTAGRTPDDIDAGPASHV
ncbi:MAG: site-2 protease family protein [Actinomycetota bacterium]|nr:site-2 protease family protein [Actinomycetota bacterium]